MVNAPGLSNQTTQCLFDRAKKRLTPKGGNIPKFDEETPQAENADELGLNNTFIWNLNVSVIYETI